MFKIFILVLSLSCARNENNKTKEIQEIRRSIEEIKESIQKITDSSIHLDNPQLTKLKLLEELRAKIGNGDIPIVEE